MMATYTLYFMRVAICQNIICSYIFRESVENIFTQNNLSFDTHSVFLDFSKTPLPLTIDTFLFGGHTLHVRGKLLFNCYSSGAVMKLVKWLVLILSPM